METEYINPCCGCHNEPMGNWCRSCQHYADTIAEAKSNAGDAKFEAEREG